MPSGGEADVSLKSYGTSTHERTFRAQAAATEQTFIRLLTERRSIGAVLLVIADAYPATADWEALRAALASLPFGQAVQRGIWSVKFGALPAEYAPYSPQHLSYQVFLSAPFHKNESKNLSDKFDEAFANAEAHAVDKPDHVRIVLMRVPEAMSLRTCDRWAKDYLASNPNSPIDGVYLYQLTVVEQPNDRSVISHAFCISQTQRLAEWHAPPGKAGRVLAMNLAVGTHTEPTHIETRGGPTPQRVEEAYHYQKGEFYTLHVVDLSKPPTAWIRNLASGIFQYAVFQSAERQMTLAGLFPPDKDITLFD